MPYKAIVRNGQLLAIVSRGYKLIENEKVEQAVKRIAEKHGLQMNVLRQGGRIHITLVDNEGNGVMVHNSVDGSMALRVDAVVKVNGSVSVIFRTRNVENVYRKHTKNIDQLVKDIEKVVESVRNAISVYKEFITTMENVNVREHVDAIMQLEELLPKRYVRPITARVKLGMYDGLTLKEVYQMLAKEIWSSKVDMRVKLQRFDTLNEAFAAMVGMAEVLGYT